MKQNHTFIPIDLVLQREIYFDNQKKSLEQFRSNLQELDNTFAVMAVFRFIFEQERFIDHITKNKHHTAKLKDEERFLDLVIGETKKVFGKEYDRLYRETKVS